MIGSLFRKREQSIPDPSMGFDCPAPSSYHNQKSSPLSSSFKDRLAPSSTNLNSNMNQNDINNTLNNNSNNNNAQETERLSNLHMPSLYGMNDASPMPSNKLSDKYSSFRMVIIQDGGIRTKQPLFDSSASHNKNISIKQKLNKRLYHSISELSVFMFGCFGMPMSESNMTTKIHYLPSLSKMHSSILITRLFSLDSSFTLKPHKIFSGSNDWEPHPFLETDEIPLNENQSTRFAIGLIIPVSSSIESVRDEITENWSHISDSLLKMQNLIVQRLKNAYAVQTRSKKNQQQLVHANNLTNINNMGNLNKSKKFSFQLYCLQTDVDIFQNFGSFIGLMVSLIEIPRLFIDLKHSNQSLIDWAATLSLWLELKDGRTHSHDHFNSDTDHDDDCSDNGLHFTHSNSSDTFHTPSYLGSYTASHILHSSATAPSTQSLKFLASLLTIFLPLRHELFEDTLNQSQNLSKLRIVIGTGNPLVSQKLIFILAGILGYEKFPELYEESQKLSSNMDSFDLEVSNIDNGDANNEENIKSHDISPPIPIPIKKIEGESSPRSIHMKNSSLVFDRSATLSSSPISIQPLPSISTISATAQSQRIVAPNLNRTSSYASLQNLSTSYGASSMVPNSIGSQDSLSSSWRNNFGSLLERWRGSVSPSPINSQISQSPNTDTSSPSMEYDEYPWYVNKKSYLTNSGLVHSSAQSFVSLNPSLNQQKSSNICTLTKSHNVGNYVSYDNYKIFRSTCNLILPNFNQIAENINHEINSIMNGNFVYNIETLDDSVLNISNNDDSAMPMPCSTNVKLPLLVGYTSQYRPEFNMMSCPNKNIQEGMFIETMKEDIKQSNIDNSNLYFINLGMRRVSLFEMTENHKKGVNIQNNISNLTSINSSSNLNIAMLSNININNTRPLYTSTLSSNDINTTDKNDEIFGNGTVKMKLKNSPRKNRSISNLTKSMESEFELHQKILFMPSRPLTEDLKIQNSRSNHKIESDTVDKYDEILEQIACMINRFFSELNSNTISTTATPNTTKDLKDTISITDSGCNINEKSSSELNKEKEEQCCDNIRKLIAELIEISDSYL